MEKITPWIYVSFLWISLFSSAVLGNFLQCPHICSCELKMELSKYLVDCSNLGLTELPSDIPYYTTNLDISGNKITQFTRSTFENLTHVKVLDASKNVIQHMDIRSFTKTKALKRLNLSGNRLRTAAFPNGLFKPLQKRLKELDITQNLYNDTYPDESLQDLQSLRILKMDCINGKL